MLLKLSLSLTLEGIFGTAIGNDLDSIYPEHQLSHGHRHGQASIDVVESPKP